MTTPETTVASTAEQDAPTHAMWMVVMPDAEIVQAAPSHAAAGRLASKMNDYAAAHREAHPDEVAAPIRVALWPGSRLRFQRDLKAWPKVCAEWGVSP